MSKKAKTYIFSILSALGAGGLSALLSGSMNIYKEIILPPLAPPSWLFPVAWTVLYILMGISAAKVYLSTGDKDDKRRGLIFYGISLFMNFMWSIIFFRLRAFLFAFVWILGLLASIVLTVYYYSKADKLASKLQVPYILWVSFASYLNFAIWALN